MMSWHPRDRRVFEVPERAVSLATAPEQLPEVWKAGTPSAVRVQAKQEGFVEVNHTVSMDATHFTSKTETEGHTWQIWPELGLSEGSIGIAQPGLQQGAQWLQHDVADAAKASSLQYDFTVTEGGSTTLTLALLPTFLIDSDHRLRYAVSLDGKPPVALDAAGAEEHRPNLSDWSTNVLRNAASRSFLLAHSTQAGTHFASSTATLAWCFSS